MFKCPQGLARFGEMNRAFPPKGFPPMGVEQNAPAQGRITKGKVSLYSCDLCGVADFLTLSSKVRRD
jgi:hypothetical protein